MQLIEAALSQKISNLHTARTINLTVKLALCNWFYDAIFSETERTKNCIAVFIAFSLFCYQVVLCCML